MRRGAIIFTILLGVISLWIARAFILPIFFGAIIAALLAGPHERLKRRMPEKLSAVLLTIGSAVLVFLPMTLLTISGVRTAVEKLRGLKEAAGVEGAADQRWSETILQMPFVDRWIGKTGSLLHMDFQEVVRTAEQFARKAGVWMADFLGTFLSSVPQFTVEFFLVLLAIYFVLIDGDRLSRFFRQHSFFAPTATDEIIDAYRELCRSVMLATLVSGLAQSATYLLGLLIVRADGIPLITLLVFLSSFIPLFGAGPVTFGFAIYTLFAKDGSTAGIVLLIAAAITGVVDNFVKPAVLKGAANLHPLIALVALFGGLEVFGFTGVFIGPIMVGLFLVTLRCLLQSAPDSA